MRCCGPAGAGCNYQHPGRGDSYNESLDQFSAHVLELSLAALQQDPTLWEKFHTGDNLLFSSDDFAAPAQSAVLSRLAAMPAVADRARSLAAACAADFASMPAILSGARPAVTPRTPTGATARRSTGPAPLPAHDRATLIHRVGDEVTVFGKIDNIRTYTNPRSGKLTKFINFGDYRRAAFVIVAFDRVSRDLKPQINTVLAKGTWVSVTGLLEPYQSKWSKDPSPEIELRWTGSLRRLNADQVEQLTVQARAGTSDVGGRASTAEPPAPVDKAASSTITAPRPPKVDLPRSSSTKIPSPNTKQASRTYRLGRQPAEPIKPQPSQTTPAAAGDDLEQRIGQFYHSPKFNQPTPQSQPSSTYQQPTHQPPAQPQPPNQGGYSAQPTRPGWWARLRRRLGL